MSLAVKHQWWEFHKKNPHIYELFKRFTMEIIRRGHEHYSSKAVFERIRWHTDVETEGNEPFKMTNNYTPYYARLFMVMHPEHEGFFRTKELSEEKAHDQISSR